MASPISAIPPILIEGLGLALVHFIWQGAAIAASAALAMRWCRGARARYAIGMGALTLMLAVATLTLFGAPASMALPAASFVFLPSLSPRLLFWVVEFWLAGVALFSLRFAGGFLLLEKRQRGQSCAASGRVLALCRDVQQRVGLSRAIRYLECGWLKVPAVAGFIRPVVMLPLAALTGLSEAQLRAVIAHELAHVRRWDFLANLFQIFAETLFFYHPAVWWLNGRIRADREICCDEIAVSQIGNRIAYADALIEYARALAWMEECKSAPGPALAANHGILSERIFHILGLPRARPRLAGLAASLMLLMAAMAAGPAMMGMARPVAAVRPRATAPVAAPRERTALATVPAVLSRPAPPAVAAPALTARGHFPPKRILVRPSPLSPETMPIVIASVDLDSVRAPDSESAAQAAPPQPRSIALARLDAAAAQYPAAIVSLHAPYGWREWGLGEATSYCKDFALQTVTQGAEQPMLVDDGLKKRLTFFYWRCMVANGQAWGYWEGEPPGYVALGAAAGGNPASVSGSWTLAIHWGPGAQAMLAERAAPRSCSFTQLGNNLSGNCTGAQGMSAMNGVIDGRQVRWSWKLPPASSGREGELDFLGVVGADGAISGQSVMLSDFDSTQLQTFTATPGLGQVASRQ